MALNAYARTVTDRIVDPVARVLVRLGCTANGLTTGGLLLTFVAVGLIVGVDQRIGAVVLALSTVTDAFDGAVARLRRTQSTFGAFYDSVADRISDAAILGAAAWLVRDRPVLFVVAMVALGGAQLTSYIRAKAESLGWNATVGVLERAERVIIMVLGFAFDLVPLALWLLAVGSLVTVAQRWVVVLRQSRAASRVSGAGP
jgi:CDP-diacylglycerol---glycerol-3-phosphate 3-phosphatidyltransferase